MEQLTNSHYTFRTQSPRTWLNYGKEATPTVTAIVSLFDKMASALVQKRQKKNNNISYFHNLYNNAQARRSLRVRGGIRTNVKLDDNNQRKSIIDFNQNYQ